MKIQAKVEQVYNLSVGGNSIGKFEVVSEWEGMIKLKSSKGVIIVDKHSDDAGVFTTLFGSLNEQNSDKDLVVIKASPGLLDELFKGVEE